MNTFQIKYRNISVNQEAIFRLDILSTSLEDEIRIVQTISRILDMAIKKYHVAFGLFDEFVQAYVDDEYPIGACCIMFFNSYQDGINFMLEMISAI